MARARGRIVYVALADARGHLMRAHLVRGLCAARGIDVDVVTTSREGQAFLAAMGTPSALLSEHFRVSFDGCHDMARARTDACVLRYYLDPTRGLADLLRLADVARGADFVVSDSLHPALLVAPLVTRMRVVNVFGENIWEAARANFAGRAPAWFDRLYRRALDRMRGAAFATIVHALRPEKVHAPRTIALPPILATPRRHPADVRAALGIGPRDPLAAVYLNPHFADPRVASAIEEALARRGFRAHAVGEGYAARPGWTARDPDLASVVRAADVLVSGAGMGALAQSRVFGTPLVALLGDQPEQRRNADALAAWRTLDRTGAAPFAPFAAVSLGSPRLGEDLDAALARVTSGARLRVLADSALDVQRAWADAFEMLVALAKEDCHDDLRFARDRDQQPGGRETARAPVRPARAPARRDGAGDARLRGRSAGAARHPEPRGAPRPLARPDALARVADGARRHP